MNNKTRKIISILMIVALVTILVMSLSACGLFTGMTEIKTVTIEQKTSWVDSDSDGIFEAELGKCVTLEVGWDNNKVKSPSIKWFVQEDGRDREQIVDATSKELTYEFSRRGDTVYTFSAVVNDVESSNSFKVIVGYAKLSAPTISCTTTELKLEQGIIQQNILDGLKDVELVADSNFDDIDPSLVVDVVWKYQVDDGDKKVAIGETTKEYTYGVSAIEDECRVTIYCELSYEGIKEVKESSIILEFVKNYKQVSKVEVLSTQTKVAETYATYYVNGSISNPGKINLSVSVSPAGTNLNSKCTWKKIDANGTTVLGVDDREIEADLSYGKNYFTATIDNVESKQIIVYSLTDINSSLSYIQSDFIWNGGFYDSYISTQEDFNAFVGYVVSLHSLEKNYMYIANSTIKSNFSKSLQTASKNGVDESGSFTFTYTPEYNYIQLDTIDGLGDPTSQCPSSYDITQKNVKVRYSKNSTTRTKLPVDSFTETMAVSNSNQLFRALSWGYKPIISDSNLQNVYNEARKVLLTYVNDGMTDLEKVKVIYDWIVTNVDYDQACLESESDNKTDYNAFYLEGVFIDKCAVCDGKSKAFTLLCGMEGITSIRIMGYADKNLGTKKASWEEGSFTAQELSTTPELSAGTPATQAQILQLMSRYGWGHAWNKVLLDANGDGVKEWYVIDTTWGDVSKKESSPTQITEFLSYSYFLVTDEDVAANHYSAQDQEIANTEYDSFKNEYVEVAGEKVSLYVTSKEQYSKIITYCSEIKATGTYLLIQSTLASKDLIPAGSKMGYNTFEDDIYYVYMINE